MDTIIDQQVAIDEALVPHARRLRIGRSNFRLLLDISSKESTLQIAGVTEALVPHARRLRIGTSNFRLLLDISSKESTLQIAHQNTQQFGAMLPIELTNADIRNYDAYKEYYAVTTGATPPKLKASYSTDEEGDDDNDDEGDDGDDGEEGNDDDDDAQDDDDQEDEGNDEGDQEEGNGEENLGMNVGREKGQDEEDEEDKLYRDVNINLGRVAPLPVSAPTLTPSTIATITTTPQAPTPLTTASSTLLQDLPNFGLLFGFDHRLKTLEENFSEFTLRDEAQKENDEFLKTIDENMQKIIKEQVKEQVKVQVSKILQKIEQTVNEQLETKVLTRSSNSSKTSYAVAVDLLKMELKKILIKKMEGKKSIHQSNEQRNLYKALNSTDEEGDDDNDDEGDDGDDGEEGDDGDDQEDEGNDKGDQEEGSDDEEEGQDEEDEEDKLYRDVNINLGRVAPLPVSAPTLTPSTIATITTTQQAPTPLTTASSTLLQDLPNFGLLFGFDHRLKTLEENFSEFTLRDEAQKENDEFLKTIDENMQKIIKEQVKEQVKVQVSKILQKIEQTVNEQLETKVLTRSSNSSKTSYAVAVDLLEMELKKILIKKMDGKKSIHQSNEQRNLYKALVEAYESDKIILDTYGDTVTLKRRRDDADKDEEPSVGSNRGSKRRREGKEPESASAPKEKATKSAGKSTQGDDDKLYMFKEGDFKRLRIQDIEDMLLLLVKGKLTILTVEERFAFNVSLRMFTRRIIIQSRMKDLQLGVESYQKKLNLTKLNTYRFDLKRKEAYIAYSNLRGFIYQNKDKQNRLMRIDELRKFSDGTLTDVHTALDDRLKGIWMKYLP
nr:hypothetical protein [Tanacetum cinerariifolium]